MAQPETTPVPRSVTHLSRWGRKGRGQEGRRKGHGQEGRRKGRGQEGLRKASAGAKGVPKKAAKKSPAK